MHAPALKDHILHIIENNTVRTQHDLQQHLKAKGLNVPQATLSRKLQALKLTKSAGVYTIPPEHNMPQLRVRSAHISDTGLIILHTPPGGAGALAHFIDQLFDRPHILGTVAGDDSVLIITQNLPCGEKVLAALGRHFPHIIT